MSVPTAYQRVDTASSYDSSASYAGIRFDGIDDSQSGVTGGGGSTGFFWCGAVKVLSGDGSSRSIWSDVGTNTGYRVRIASTNQLALGAGNGTAFTSATTSDSVLAGGTYVLTVWDDGTNLNAQVNQGTVAQTARPVVSAGPGTFSIAKDNNGSAAFANIILYGSVYRQNGGVSDSIRAKVQRAIARTAGIGF
jgi:hypothetical protein